MVRFKIILIILSVAVIFSACSNNSEDSSSSSSPSSSSSESSSSSTTSSSSVSEESSQPEADLIDFTSYIETVSALNTEIAFFEVDSNISSTNLGLNSLNTTQIVQLLDATGFVSDEVVIVVTPSAEDAEKVSAALSAHVEKLIEDFTDYNPQEVPKLESAIYQTENNITALFVGSFAEQYRDEFITFMGGL